MSPVPLAAHILVAEFAFIIYITCSLPLFQLCLALSKCDSLTVCVCVAVSETFKYAHWHLALCWPRGRILGSLRLLKYAFKYISSYVAACMCALSLCAAELKLCGYLLNVLALIAVTPHCLVHGYNNDCNFMTQPG